MADHVRKQFRAAAVTRLTGLTTTGARVFPSRVYPVQEAELPGLLVYTQSDAVEALTLDVPEFQQRATELRVEGLASVATGMDDTLDQISKEVEIALASPLTVDGKSLAVTYLGCDVELRGPEGSRDMGAVVMRFSADLLTLASAPDALLS